MAPTGFNRNEAQKSTALKLLAEQEGVEVDLESTEAKRVLRKIDMRIMPLVLGLYTLQLLVSNDSRPSRSVSNIKSIIGQKQFVIRRVDGHQRRFETKWKPVRLVGLHYLVRGTISHRRYYFYL